MSKVVVTKKSLSFNNASDAAWDMALGHMGIDILRLSQMQVPHKTGRLESSKTLRQLGKKRWEIRYRTNYAETTHENRRGVRFHKGRKDHYLSDPGNQVAQNKNTYYDEAMGFIKGQM